MNGFKDVFGISSRELAELTFSGFDLNGDGVIDFNEFVHGFSSICERAPQLERLKFGFNMFDLDKDGFIKTSELKEIMQLIAGQKMSYLPSDQIEVLVETAIQNFDPDKKGTIDFDTFKINVSKYTFLSNIGSVDLNKYLSNDPKK
ncbi:calcineurin subunit B [Histomonas meleagridis]|uniref:calcineurin subunit B n=1 Tax=Histomonas meleagridis TaxID=135588 RepID=UPI003559ED58|nr:calcineurin subunit B [Histomonas meleagridis]KAH0801918.1 calcineurin subunit B [Histomonas meleagridis]